MPLHLFLIALLAFTAPAAYAGDHRTRIVLIRYDGAVEGSPAAVSFEAFKGLLKSRINGIRDQLGEAALSSGADLLADFGHVEHLVVEVLDEGADSSHAQLRSWIRNEGYLQAYLGSIFAVSETSFEIHTRCSFLEDPGDSQMRTLDLTLRLPDDYANFRDSHSLMLLYGVAREALRAGAPPESVAIVLGEAGNLIADIERRGDVPADELQALKAVWTELRDAL